MHSAALSVIFVYWLFVISGVVDSCSVYSGHHSLLIPPTEVEQNPALWLSIVSQHRGLSVSLWDGWRCLTWWVRLTACVSDRRVECYCTAWCDDVLSVKRVAVSMSYAIDLFQCHVTLLCFSAWHILFLRRDGTVYPRPWHVYINPEIPRRQPIQRPYPVCDCWRTATDTIDAVLLQAVLSAWSFSACRQHKFWLPSGHWCLPTGLSIVHSTVDIDTGVCLQVCRLWTDL